MGKVIHNLNFEPIVTGGIFHQYANKFELEFCKSNNFPSYSQILKVNSKLHIIIGKFIFW